MQCSPSFIEEIVNKRPAEGKNVTFSCKFTGNPLPGNSQYSE